MASVARATKLRHMRPGVARANENSGMREDRRDAVYLNMQEIADAELGCEILRTGKVKHGIDQCHATFSSQICQLAPLQMLIFRALCLPNLHDGQQPSNAFGVRMEPLTSHRITKLRQSLG